MAHRGRMLLRPVALAAIGHGAANAQTRHQQALQFPAPGADYNFQEVGWLTVGPPDSIDVLQRGGLDVSIWSPPQTWVRVQSSRATNSSR